jgi:hypothetical protein
VLKPPDGNERIEIESAIERALQASPDILAGNMERAMTTLHTRPAASSPDKKEQ